MPIWWPKGRCKGRRQPALFAAGAAGGDLGQSRDAFLGHYGGQDEWEPLEGVRAMEQEMRTAGRDVTLHVYPEVGHWFCEADRPDAFEPEAADLAWKRTVSFLQEQLG